jgi:hypothetical protein
MSKDKYAYKKRKARREVLVDVDLPTGNIIQMAKPSKYSVLFGMQNIPSSLTDRAVEAWKEKGVGDKGETEAAFLENTTDAELMLLIKTSMQVRDEVIRLSRTPKLVLVDEGAAGTMCIFDMDEDDLDFLFQWVASGGTPSPRLASFRQRPEQDVVGESDGEELGDEAISAAGVGGRR